MDREPPRRFNLLDGMAAVAATTIGFALIREVSLEFFDHRVNGFNQSAYYSRSEQILFCFLIPWPFVAAWTLAAFTMRLRRPRPVRRLLFHQPGMIASSSALLALCVCQLVVSVWHGSNAYWTYSNSAFKLFCLSPAFCGIAVVTSWTTARLAGSWAPESCWVDRLGRWLGFVWVAMVPASLSFVFR